MLECWTKEVFHGENLQSNLLSSNERRLWADEKEPGSRLHDRSHTHVRMYMYIIIRTRVIHVSCSLRTCVSWCTARASTSAAWREYIDRETNGREYSTATWLMGMRTRWKWLAAWSPLTWWWHNAHAQTLPARSGGKYKTSDDYIFRRHCAQGRWRYSKGGDQPFCGRYRQLRPRINMAPP